MSYPRIEQIKLEGKKLPTFTKAQKKAIRGEQITIPGQAVKLETALEQMAKGFPVPMQRQEVVLHDDINQVLEGKKYDIPSDIKFATMSKVERQRVINNIGGIKQQLSEKLAAQIAAKQQADLKITATEPTAPPTEPV